MSNASDFIIENGVLTKYVGPGGDVVVPDGVTRIDDNAFLYCKTIQTVKLSEGVAKLGFNAFQGCEQMSEITLPNSLIIIFPKAFARCINLKYIKIPSQVSNIRERAFLGCRNLTTIDVDKDNNKYSSDDGVLFNKEKTALLMCPEGKTGKYTIPDTTLSIAHEAFSFIYPSNLLVSIPDSVTRINEESFSGCTVMLSDNRQEFLLKSTSTIAVIGNGTVFKSLPNGAKQSTALYWLEHENVFPADASKAICAYIRRARKTLFSNVIDKDESVLAKFIVAAKPQNDELDGYIAKLNDGKSVAKLTILLDYKEKVFGSSSDRVDNLELDEKPMTLAEMRKAFKVGIKDDYIIIKGYKKEDTVVTIPDHVDGKAIREIGKGAFSDQDKITEINLPDTITTIGPLSFDACFSLACIHIPKNVNTIGEKAFEYCHALQEIEFNDGLKEIPKFTFRNCEKLSTIVFPKALESIGMNAFADCKSLTDLFFSENLKDIARGAFTRCKHITIHAPAGSYAEQYAKEHNIPFVAE